MRVVLHRSFTVTTCVTLCTSIFFAPFGCGTGAVLDWCSSQPQPNIRPSFPKTTCTWAPLMCRTGRNKTLRRTCVVNFSFARRRRLTRPHS